MLPDECRSKYPILKSMRLACRQFAYLPTIMEALFSHIQFLASPQQVALAGVMDFKNLATYVKGVKFQPDKYSWVMEQVTFEEMVMLGPLGWEARWKNAQAAGLKGADINSMMQLHWRAHVNRNLDGKAPWSDDELRDSYESYMAKAHARRNMYDNGDVQKGWAAALKQLPSIGQYGIGKEAFDALDKSDPSCYESRGTQEYWQKLGCDVHEHNCGARVGCHTDRECHNLEAPVGEALSNAVLQSLVMAGSKPVKLIIEYTCTGEFAWADNGQLDSLDLSHLRSLYFCPNILGRSDLDGAGLPGATYVEGRCEKAVMALIKRCQNNLRDLEIFPGDTNDWPLTWPVPPEDPIVDDSFQVIELPALERFQTAVPLNLGSFARFLRLAKKMKRLELDSCTGGEDGEWRDLWRAIRYHPSRMQLNFDQVPCNDATELSMDHFTGDVSREGNDPNDPWMNIHYELGMYLSNRGPWGRSCRMWFDGLGSDDEYTDSESEAEQGSDGDENED
jgi:hypothetical protein